MRPSATSVRGLALLVYEAYKSTNTDAEGAVQAAMKLPGVATAAAPPQQPARGAATGKKGNALKGPTPEERAQVLLLRP